MPGSCFGVTMDYGGASGDRRQIWVNRGNAKTHPNQSSMPKFIGEEGWFSILMQTHHSPKPLSTCALRKVVGQRSQLCVPLCPPTRGPGTREIGWCARARDPPISCTLICTPTCTSTCTSICTPICTSTCTPNAQTTQGHLSSEDRCEINFPESKERKGDAAAL